jgi:uncharacterized protein YndB with AHSA1/START domain
MHHVRTETRIDRPVELVYDYATTPGNWPRWHPSSLGVRGATDHSLEVGEQVTEDFEVAGRRGTAVWTVSRREPPNVWAIDGQSHDGNRATITYTLTPGPDDGTTFRRDLVFTGLLPQLDWSVIGPVIEGESAEALRRLKVAIEGSVA